MTAPIKKNDLFTVTIDGYNSEGMGVCRIDGIVVFVKGAIKGETCEIRILKVNKKLAYAKIERMITPSSARCTSDCAAYPKCGGCGLRHMTYEEELRFKERKVLDIMERIGGFSVTYEGIFGSPSEYRYRNKAQYPVRTVNGSPNYGFYRVGSHDIIPCDDCMIQTTTANEIARCVCDVMKAKNISAYDEITHKGMVRHIYVRTSHDESEAICCIIANADSMPHTNFIIKTLTEQFPQLKGILLNVNKRPDNVIVGDKTLTLWGRDYIMDTLCGKTFRCSMQSFFQINHAQTNHLYAAAAEYARDGKETIGTLLDLYCGVGTVGISMASPADKLIGIEIIPEAIRDAKENAIANGLINTEFICDDAGKAAIALAKRGLRPNVVVVDPPRKGLGDDAIEIMSTLSPDRIVYISCDPATQARDAKKLIEYGYVPQKMKLYDMFPRTEHIESCMMLERKE